MPDYGIFTGLVNECELLGKNLAEEIKERLVNSYMSMPKEFTITTAEGQKTIKLQHDPKTFGTLVGVEHDGVAWTVVFNTEDEDVIRDIKTLEFYRDDAPIKTVLKGL